MFALFYLNPSAITVLISWKSFFFFFAFKFKIQSCTLNIILNIKLYKLISKIITCLDKIIISKIIIIIMGFSRMNSPSQIKGDKNQHGYFFSFF